jgi:hypothetical protein
MCATKRWSDFSSSTEIARRAGGRRRYNAQRQAKAAERRLAILDILGAYVILNHFGVNRSTICRDIEAIRQEWRHQHMCYVCGKCLGWSLGKLVRLHQRLKRYQPDSEMTCCMKGFVRREIARQKKRLSKQEARFRLAIENL